jgi:hypothetical protein
MGGCKCSEVEVAANLLQCDRGFLSRALTYRSIATGAGRRQSVINVPLDVPQAIFTRDALSKALYDRIFNWIVAHINTVFKVDKPEEKLSIGLLDIYGFEVFDVCSSLSLVLSLAFPLFFSREKIVNYFDSSSSRIFLFSFNRTTASNNFVSISVMRNCNKCSSN